MRRIISLDIGEARIGVAMSDPLGFFAQGVTVLKAKEDWLPQLKEIVDKNDADTLLIGLPVRTNGTEGPEAEKMRGVADMIKQYFPDVKIVFWDERFTTTIAQQALLEADVSRAGRKQSVDKIAATLLLQSYLDRERTQPR
ncbi:MAG: Holliday junction resolvase RuvX [Synergistaceae bacterium]|nr:Holliday junction resolvase RuvX [Synergistaceae bacterium]